MKRQPKKPTPGTDTRNRPILGTSRVKKPRQQTDSKQRGVDKKPRTSAGRAVVSALQGKRPTRQSRGRKSDVQSLGSRVRSRFTFVRRTNESRERIRDNTRYPDSAAPDIRMAWATNIDGLSRARKVAAELLALHTARTYNDATITHAIIRCADHESGDIHITVELRTESHGFVSCHVPAKAETIKRISNSDLECLQSISPKFFDLRELPDHEAITTPWSTHSATEKGMREYLNKHLVVA